LTEVIRQAGLKESDIDWVIPHQANTRIIEAAIKKLSIPAERYAPTSSVAATHRRPASPFSSMS
jgi:3-oxoacyl-[acyl-carrier-protein] synthase III